MTRSRLSSTFALAFAVGLAAASACCRSGNPGATAQGSAAIGTSPYDAETTDTARVLAGMQPLRAGAFAAVVGLPEWRAWEAESRDRWGEAWRERVQPVRAWAHGALEGRAPECQTLLHPFGGTALLAAYMLFPSCEGYVLVGTEPVGQLPSLDAVTPSQLLGFAEDLRREFPEVFPGTPAVRRTGAAAAPRLTGAIPSLLVQLARLDARIVSAARFDITADGRPLESIPIRGGNARPAALSLTFEVPNGRPQSLVYSPAELDDASLRKRPGAWTFLRLQAPFVTLLLHRPPAERFALLRDLVGEQSQVILEAPPPWVPATAPEWAVATLPALPAPAFPRPFAPSVAVRQKAAAKPGGRR